MHCASDHCFSSRVGVGVGRDIWQSCCADAVVAASQEDLGFLTAGEIKLLAVDADLTLFRVHTGGKVSGAQWLPVPQTPSLGIQSRT